MNMTKVDGILLTYEQFLAPAELESITAFAARTECKFSPATTVQMGRPGTVNTARRRAVVLTEVDTDEIGALFKAKVERAVPTVLEELQLPIRQPGRVSVQMTSTGDGGFYKPHTDNYVHDMNRRRLSFVYYCNRYPISFQGGILRIYDTREYAKLRDPKTKVHTVTPVQNRMVFFQSDYVHEISPVVCASNRLVDTRLTVNGWIYFA